MSEAGPGEAKTSYALFRCQCGAVQGRVAAPRPDNVSRVTCYCDDCQAYAHHLGRSDLLDARGGSDMVQTAPASLRFTAGQERLVGLRFSPKGLYRWYSSCCNTPMGNTVGTAIPFVGLMSATFGDAAADRWFGRPSGAIMGQFAIGGPPPGTKGIRFSLMAPTLLKVLGWKLRGLSWPHPFFDRATRKPVFPISVLAPAERERLRPLCGPNPVGADAPQG